MLEVARGCADDCFAQDGSYMPELLGFAIDCRLLTVWANFTLPKNIERCYELVTQTDAVDFVSRHIDAAQYDALYSAIRERIEARLSQNQNLLLAELGKVRSLFSQLLQQMQETFGDINAADLDAIVQAASDGKVDEGKIVQAFLTQKEKPEHGAG